MKGSVGMYCRSLEKRIKMISDTINLQQSKEEARRKGLVKGLVLGTLFGAVLGVLYAPDKGEVTRQKTRDEAMRLKEQVEGHFETGKERAAELLEEKKGRAEEIWLSTKADFITEPDHVTDEEEADDKEES